MNSRSHQADAETPNAIQIDEHGIVTSFQINDRCATGCGRYLGYIADEMNLGLHELGPFSEQATRKAASTMRTS